MGDRGYHAANTLLECLQVASSYDQLNLGGSACLEVVARRLQGDSQDALGRRFAALLGRSEILLRSDERSGCNSAVAAAFRGDPNPC